MNLDIDSTIELLEGISVPRPAFDEAVVATLKGTTILPTTRVQDITRLCAWLSCDKFEVSARIECRKGKPVAYLVRLPRDQADLPDFLRKQAD